MAFIQKIGERLVAKIEDLGNSFALSYSALTSLFVTSSYQRRSFWDNLTKQVYFTGVQALKLTVFISLFIGGIIIIQTMNQLPQVGGEELIGTVLVVVNVREIGPLVVAFVVIGRSATAITTELAGMRVNGQFDMLLATGVNPHIYLFAPRIWGMVVSLFSLNIFFMFFSLIGGFVMARVITYIDFYFLFQGFIQSITIVDIVVLILKTLFLSMGIAVIAIREALKVDISTTEIPQAATSTVMQTLAYVLLIDIFFAGIIYL